MRKITGILLSAMLLLGIVGTTDAMGASKKNVKGRTSGVNASKRHSGTNKKKATQTAYPHFYLQEYVIKNIITPKSFSLNGPVKTLRTITPVYEGDYENRIGATCNYSFDTDGKPLSICYDDFGDAGGWARYYITYNDNGNFESIKVDVMEGTQDSCHYDQSVKATYTFDYDGDKITRITEQTTSVWGKSVNWKPFHYSVTYADNGQINRIICEEDPRVSFTFVNNQLVGKRFINVGRYTGMDKCGPSWELETFEHSDFDYETTDQEIKTEIDRYNNWIKHSWFYELETGSIVEDGEFREITYY